jgi:hypothetical protein
VRVTGAITPLHLVMRLVVRRAYVAGSRFMQIGEDWALVLTTNIPLSDEGPFGPQSRFHPSVSKTTAAE